MEKKQLIERGIQFIVIFVVSVSLGYVSDDITRGIIHGILVGIGFTLIGPIVFDKIRKRG
jgi:RsiW-degrading membrane proteinase PrsW (M82 family)